MTTLNSATEGAESRSTQPRAFIVTIYGLYAREVGGWIGVSALIRLMAQLNVDAQSVRSAISRLKRRGLLDARRVDGVAGYEPSQQAREILDEGDQRIFGRQRAELEDGWLLAVFSVPESQRQLRHALRSRLSWLGFGTTTSGVWIAPRYLYDETREVLERYQLSEYVDLFQADYLAFGDIRELVGEWWDLESLQHLYDDFLTSFRPVLNRWRRRRTDNDADAFADYVRALTAWRRLPFLDPGLPPELLPHDWHALRAATLFDELKDRLAEPAHHFAKSVIDEHPGRAAAAEQP
ncbi:phenylacetic acid degradation operon negative regulatory protein [Prauserella sediminis]|uniref:Phenylacetic acid degradation operon negative regulatory protein n=1 Tax=Prauserella sediminis TaxID=577680 RepID=A0A839XR46_9PSEU|nr:PaaX family transcriptional regulator C-terminal domain-containing protein [Prauserella sediminis]MBB3664449.1 phenylacetic acid degradation operon negative regulatory protein [Prauserella sediminis]